jgi:hypothetical protein
MKHHRTTRQRPNVTSALFYDESHSLPSFSTTHSLEHECPNTQHDKIESPFLARCLPRRFAVLHGSPIRPGRLMVEIPHESCAASMILPFAWASTRSPVVSLFPAMALVWLGGGDAETASFQDHYPHTDGAAETENQERAASGATRTAYLRTTLLCLLRPLWFSGVRSRYSLRAHGTGSRRRVVRRNPVRTARSAGPTAWSATSSDTTPNSEKHRCRGRRRAGTPQLPPAA